MSNEIKVSPTPIQRNAFDVATELTQLYFQRRTPTSADEISETYAKFFAVASLAYTGYAGSCAEFLPESMKKLAKE